MSDSGVRRKSPGGRAKRGFRHNWCCSSMAPASPDDHYHHPSRNLHSNRRQQSRRPKSPSSSRKSGSNPPESPVSSRLGLGFIDRRRILSPGRVSPIESASTGFDLEQEQGSPTAPPVPPPPPPPLPSPSHPPAPPQPVLPPVPSLDAGDALVPPTATGGESSGDASARGCDVRLSLRGKGGQRILMDLHSEVLCSRSSVFAAKISESRAAASGPDSGPRRCWVEVVDVSDVEAYRETIELMYERNVPGRLMKAGVSRCIRMLEVSFSIMFELGVRSCLQYLEAVPWTEEEEEALRNLFTKHKFDKVIAQEVLARLHPQEPPSCQKLTMRLIQSVASGTDDKARRELKSLVQGLLSKSSVYQKDPHDLNKDEIYSMCNSCLQSLTALFLEATNSSPDDRTTKESMPLIARMSLQVDNLTWLLEILIEKQMAEDFVGIWADQSKLLMLYKETSAMVRYEVSRVSACLFLAMGRGRLQSSGAVRCRFVEVWLGPMLVDFGWLQRCSKGLDMKLLEEAIGQTVLTLPLKNQQSLLMCWFECFTKHGNECPNLSKAFQIWWRRSFSKASDIQSGVMYAPC
ncbi:PRL1-IFG BTB/POZ domain-containing protein [Nymphaea thermarum]|nr:PRL1-IFG BTB/POZ domain-containing protein [Nymphaea thermarum]